MFKISPKVYTSMFSLPTEIADRGLKFASGEQLKVIIAIFRNPEANVEEIAKFTNLSLATVKECIEYWADNGILENENMSDSVKTENQNREIDVKKIKKPIPEIHFTNPTQAEIERIIKENGAMKRLFLEAQEILGRTIGFSMQCTIYSVVNRYGITPDVANCLLYFAKSINATSQNDILKIAKYWAESEITTLAAADDYIIETTNALKLFCELAVRTNNDTSPPTFAVLEMICEWIRWGYKIDAIEKAFNIMKAEKQTGRLVWNNFTHMNGTIKKWRTAGIYTLEDIEKGTKKFAPKQNKKNEKPKETSFSIELAEEMAKEHRKDFGTKKNKRRSKGA